MLSKDAHIDALPDMAIDYSNEVKATHSASTSPIDKEVLFYLASRGIEEDSARRYFITAFIAKYLSNIDNGVASEVAMSIMLDKLEKEPLVTIPDVNTQGNLDSARVSDEMILEIKDLHVEAEGKRGTEGIEP